MIRNHNLIRRCAPGSGWQASNVLPKNVMKRHFSDYRHTTDFDDLVFVRCRACQSPAAIRTTRKQTENYGRVAWTSVRGDERIVNERRTFTCSACGQIRDNLSGTLNPYSIQPSFAGYDLYLLQTPCCGGCLWALNLDHIDFLESYVSADLRERDIANHDHHSLIANLPKWICLAKNRSAVLRALQKLRTMAEQASGGNGGQRC